MDREKSGEELIVHGAKEHNLKDVTLRLPRYKLICITGLSGSGKSSLAFDTIYAEGQRRYVESLSAYARQFLQMMQKPDVESIEGLSPAISIDQRTTSRNPRSPASRSTPSSTRSCACPRGRASRSTRPWRAIARASSRICSSTCAARAS